MERNPGPGVAWTEPPPPCEPSFDAIAMFQGGTIIHIPRGAVREVEETYSHLIDTVVRERTWEALHALWAFPKAVLAPIGRMGKGH